MENIQGLKPGATLRHGTYRIERILGQGGFGITYLATDLNLDRKVAVKEFFPETLCVRDGDTSHVTLGTISTKAYVEQLKAKFLKEARNIAKFDYPGIIRIITAFEENNTAYYVMEYIDGITLAEIVKRYGPMSPDRALNYIGEVGEALEFVHSHHIAHLDVKPANIMVRTSDNMPVLIDFGLSKQYDSDGHQTSTSISGMSPGYAPVEQYNKGGVSEFSPQTDIYSLAATLYYLLSGKVPPEATSLIDEPLQFPPSVPYNLIAPIRKAMSTARTGRQESVGEFLYDINNRNNNQEETEIAIKPYGNQTVYNPAYVQSYNAPQQQQYANPYGAQYGGSSYGTPSYGGSPYVSPHGAPPKRSRSVLPWIIAAAAMIVIACGIITVWSIIGGGDTGGGEDVVTQNDNEAAMISRMVENGNAAYERENYTEAYNWYNQAAEKGNADAQYMLGRMYRLSQGVATDNSSAAKWYRKAAEQGHADAQFFLGKMYFEGEGVAKDYAEAVRLYSRSADQGNVNAQLSLAMMYRYGTGVTQDYKAAAELYRKAAEQGNAIAQNTLGLFYEKGYGVSLDYKMAAEWYGKAAAQGNSMAQANLGYLAQFGLGVPQNDAEAVRWYRKSADQGNARGQYRLACMYFYGTGVTQDRWEAKRLWEKAAAQGDKEAKEWLREFF